MLEYIVLVFVACLLTAIAYIRIKMKFWHLQPVFHFYNLAYWLSPPGVIQADLPIIGNKYLNIINIKTVAITDDDNNDVTVERACHLIQEHFVTDSRVTYKPSKTDILAYLKHSNHIGYMSFYMKPKMLFVSTTTPFLVEESLVEESEKIVDYSEKIVDYSEKIVDYNRLVAVSTARPLNVHCNVRSGANFVTYYVDNLCVVPECRTQGLAPQMIQTQCYNLRHLNKKIQTCLFKREGALTAIVPLVAFHTSAYNILTLPLKPLHASITCIDVAAKQINLFTEFVKTERCRFSWAIMPDISNLVGLLKAECISIHLLMCAGQVLAAYVFRLPKLAYTGGKQAIELITVIKSQIQLPGDNDDNNIFVNGLGLALKQVLSRNAKVEIILIEANADATQLISSFSTVAVLFKSPTAFYWYNYAAYTCEPSKFLILY